MLVVVSYDVSTLSSKGRKRLRRIAKHCLDYGQRVQNSVFECNVDPTQWEIFKNKLLNEMNKKEDSLRFYYLGKNWNNRVEHIGIKPSIDMEGLLVI